ncbi:MAG: integrase core domain-containing protein [Candidatus Binatia bacterium]
MHKHTKLLPYQRREAYQRWCNGEKVVDIAAHFAVSRTTLYRVFKKARLGIFGNYTSKNFRYRQVVYGLKSLTKTQRVVAAKLARKAHRLKRYEKDTPGEMVHFDTKRLPRITGEGDEMPPEWLYVAIDDFSRLLVADILPSKMSYSSAIHLTETIETMPFPIQVVYSDNGSEYRGKDTHAFVRTCKESEIKQQFTKPHHPYTNGKAERVIQTLMREWHYGRHFTSRDERRRFLYAYVSWYNEARSHQSLGGQSPLSRLRSFVARVKPESVNNPG